MTTEQRLSDVVADAMSEYSEEEENGCEAKDYANVALTAICDAVAERPGLLAELGLVQTWPNDQWVWRLRKPEGSPK